jgi:hypothetical protein
MSFDTIRLPNAGDPAMLLLTYLVRQARADARSSRSCDHCGRLLRDCAGDYLASLRSTETPDGMRMAFAMLQTAGA